VSSGVSALRGTCVFWCLGGALPRSALSDIVARRAAGCAEALGSQAGALTAPRLPPVQSAEFRLVEAGLESLQKINKIKPGILLPCFLQCLGIRIGMFLGLMDPDPLVRGTDPDADPSNFSQRG
jgi:hypothetical protein